MCEPPVEPALSRRRESPSVMSYKEGLAAVPDAYAIAGVNYRTYLVTLEAVYRRLIFQGPAPFLAAAAIRNLPSIREG